MNIKTYNFVQKINVQCMMGTTAVTLFRMIPNEAKKSISFLYHAYLVTTKEWILI